MTASNEALTRLRQTRLATGSWREVAGGEATRLLLVLAALARRPARISYVMNLTPGTGVHCLLNFGCRSVVLIYSSIRITVQKSPA